MINESARSYIWLSSHMHIGQPASAAQRLWDQTVQIMSERPQTISYLMNWLSDFWLARGMKISSEGLLFPRWDPPASLTEWHGGGSAMAAAANLSGRSTNHAGFLKSLEENASLDTGFDEDAGPSFERWQSEVSSLDDPRLVQVGIVLAWLSTSVGSLLTSILLTRPEPALLRTSLVLLSTPQQFKMPPSSFNDLEERRLEYLYNWRVLPGGRIDTTNVFRVGQGEGWRDHWRFLNADLGTQQVLEAVQMASRLMRSPILGAVLTGCLASPDAYPRTISLAILRRCLLTLKVMTWLETALAHPWQSVQTHDLSCFAFNAVKPDWPSRCMGISHRSADVKETLFQMKLWRSARCAIDAIYVPSWETNMGMMWGLFSAPALIARIESPRYRDSVWCLREIELIDYLIAHSDFLADRCVIDIPATRMRELDGVSVFWEKNDRDEQPEGDILSSFPPVCEVWSVPSLPEWQVKLFRAAAAIRLMNISLSNSDRVNSLADQVCAGFDPQGLPLDDNPDGWQSCAAVLRDLRALDSANSGQLPVHLPSAYSPEDRQKDVELSQRIPNLDRCPYSLLDVLVAFEWLRSVWPSMAENSGDLLVIDCQALPREIWLGAVEVSLARGLTSLKLPVPLWFLQNAGQKVENWPLVSDRPIFTQHFPDQFAWMVRGIVPPEEALRRYPAESGLELSATLLSLCGLGGGPNPKLPPP